MLRASFISVLVAALAAASATGGTPAAVDPTAVPLGDGHVSTVPKVGFVDSCVTSFGGISRGVKGRSVLVGYALDGYGIYLTEDAGGSLPADMALDACHSTTSVVPWDGKPTRMYHYVATLEYPYTVGCFHGTPISSRRAVGGGGPPPPPGGR